MVTADAGHLRGGSEYSSPSRQVHEVGVAHVAIPEPRVLFLGTDTVHRQAM